MVVMMGCEYCNYKYTTQCNKLHHNTPHYSSYSPSGVKNLSAPRKPCSCLLLDLGPPVVVVVVVVGYEYSYYHINHNTTTIQYNTLQYNTIATLITYL